MSYEDENTKVIWLEEGDILLLVSAKSRQVHEVSENEKGKLETATYKEVGSDEGGGNDNEPKDDDEDEDDEDEEEGPPPLP